MVDKVKNVIFEQFKPMYYWTQTSLASYVLHLCIKNELFAFYEKTSLRFSIFNLFSHQHNKYVASLLTYNLIYIYHWLTPEIY